MRQIKTQVRQLHELMRLMIHKSVARKPVQRVGYTRVRHPFFGSNVTNPRDSLLLLKLKYNLEIIFETFG